MAETTATAVSPRPAAAAIMDDDASSSLLTTAVVKGACSKSELMQQRLRTFKQKANQARQLNQKAVREEAGDQTSSSSKQHTKKKQVDSIQQESAAESLVSATKRQEKEELNRFHVNDYHNPEGQYRNYLRSIKSVPRTTPQQNDETSREPSGELSTFRLLDTTLVTTAAAAAANREGAHQVAEELHRRYAKSTQRAQKRKDKCPDVEGSYINKRNKKFNEKISRNYDAHTAEIRQNLERGTAL